MEKERGPIPGSTQQRGWRRRAKWNKTGKSAVGVGRVGGVDSQVRCSPQSGKWRTVNPTDLTEMRSQGPH